MIDPRQPGKVLRFKAKPGKGDELFALCAKLSDESDATDKVIIARAEDDPDTLWAMEFFKSDEALAAQDADPRWEELHAQIGALMEEDFTLALVRAYYAHF
ncbi:hypothetical protein OHA99_02730 [Streptomyces coelicoflavus]|uniref:putative quinol monooxygenase n=1 Tax=Streptomyces TaxID=1883 RepID=UPI001D172DD1|nr:MULTISPECIES: hypothetical protein [Streptomyces]MCX5040936.1 hypothetical protein [Streptomyces coelicoflavus]